MARVGRFGPPLALMGLIWFLSAQPNLSSGLEFDTPLRKLAHMTVFGALLLLWWRALGPRNAVAITLAYAGVDEWHQTWVEGRHGALSDVAIDMLGGGIASAASLRWRHRAKMLRPTQVEATEVHDAQQAVGNDDRDGGARVGAGLGRRGDDDGGR